MKLELLVSRKYRFTEDWPIRDSIRDDTSRYSICLEYRCTTIVGLYSVEAKILFCIPIELITNGHGNVTKMVLGVM